MKLALHTKIMIGFIVGTLGGLAAYYWGSGSPWVESLISYVTYPAGQIFLRLLFMLVIPLLFSALVLGVADLGDIRSLGRLGGKTLAYTVVVSAIAVIIGLVMVNVFQPGVGIDEATRAALLEGAAERAQAITGQIAPTSGVQLLIQIVPDNFFKAAAASDMLGVMFFALMIGVGLVLTRTPAAARFKGGVQGLYDVAMTLIGLVIRLAPYAVACLLFNLTAKLGWDILEYLAKYVLVVVGALAIHQFVVYSLAVKYFGGMSPLRFFRDIEEAMITAFSTASSSATLPTSLKVAEENLKLPSTVSRFVLTIGATANQNGTALFEGVTVIFLAQFFGVDLTIGQQVLVLFVCILGGVGTAGVPSGSIPVVAMILGMVGVPVEGIGMILGVNHFLDMCRTTLNVTGDLAAAVVVAHGEPVPAKIVLPESLEEARD